MKKNQNKENKKKQHKNNNYKISKQTHLRARPPL